MNQKYMEQAVREQLATDLNCSTGDLLSGGFVYCEAKQNPGRRPFPRNGSHFEMLTMGRGVVVSATEDLLGEAKRQLRGANAYDAFAMPFIRGQSLYFLPDLTNFRRPSVPGGVQITLTEREAIHAYYTLDGFRYALQYDANHPRPDVLAAVVRVDGKVIGIAGASEDCEMMWQIGIDVLEGHRSGGLAHSLVGILTDEILSRGRIPYYGTSTSNVASQRVAHRAGYRIAWTCTYRAQFGDVLTGPCG